jgi:hypothetical protein
VNIRPSSSVALLLLRLTWAQCAQAAKAALLKIDMNLHACPDEGIRFLAGVNLSF